MKPNKWYRPPTPPSTPNLTQSTRTSRSYHREGHIFTSPSLSPSCSFSPIVDLDPSFVLISHSPSLSVTIPPMPSSPPLLPHLSANHLFTPSLPLGVHCMGISIHSLCLWNGPCVCSCINSGQWLCAQVQVCCEQCGCWCEREGEVHVVFEACILWCAY